MSHPSRTRTRNRLYLIGVLPALLMLLVSGRIALLLLDESSGLSAFGAEEYGDARDDFAANQVLNPFERWIAHFDEGTARYRAGDLGGAVSAYEDALDEEVPAEWRCRVRNNLALAHEGLGDAALDKHGRVAAEGEWLVAREVLAGCLADGKADHLDEADTDGDGTVTAEEYAAVVDDEMPSAEEADTDGDGTVSAEEYAAAVVVGGTASAEETAVVIDARLAAKLEDRDPATPPTPTDPPPATDSVAERERRLAERDRQALEQRRQQEERREEREDERSDEESGRPRTPEW